MKTWDGNCCSGKAFAKKEDVDPSNFDKMNVGAAIPFSFLKTASALIMAVINKISLREALTSAHCILEN